MRVASSPKTIDSSQTIEQTIQGYALVLYTLSEIDSFTEFAMEASLSVVSAHAGSFFLWDEFQKELVLKAARGPYSARLMNARLKLREGISGWVGQSGEPLLVEDSLGDQRLHEFKRHDHYRSYSFISVPLIIENKLVGVINVTERQNFLPFTEEDLRRIQALGHHIATAYEKLKLIEQLRLDNQTLHHTLVKANEKLHELEPLSSVGKLATNLAHEINNPIDAIRRYVNLALDQAGEDTLTREYLLKAKKGIHRAIRIIRGLLQFSRDSHKTTARSVEIHVVIRKSLDGLAQDPAFQDIEIREDYSAHPSFVLDYGILLVLHNLYKNAQQAMNGKGILTIHTRRREQTVFIQVQDTGTGIPESLQKRLFDPFVTTKHESNGMGIGLTICREILERSGGKIEVDLSRETGACFVIALPCQK